MIEREPEAVMRALAAEAAPAKLWRRKRMQHQFQSCVVVAVYKPADAGLTSAYAQENL